MGDAVAFFDRQFARQVESHEFALNPFEEVALPFVSGRVLDLGCGLGNLALEAGRRGCDVQAVDASLTAVGRINRDAAAENLRVRAIAADLSSYAIEGGFDTLVSIGLLMFFPRDRALSLLESMKDCVRQGGCAIVNVLTEGTTYLDMFGENPYTLFGRDELAQRFAGWEILISRHDDFAAPGGTRKAFSTVIARRTAARQQ